MAATGAAAAAQQTAINFLDRFSKSVMPPGVYDGIPQAVGETEYGQGRRNGNANVQTQVWRRSVITKYVPSAGNQERNPRHNKATRR